MIDLFVLNTSLEIELRVEAHSTVTESVEVTRSCIGYWWMVGKLNSCPASHDAGLNGYGYFQPPYWSGGPS